jgi:Zn-dependent peptidase ImmA (M78 family)
MSLLRKKLDILGIEWKVEQAEVIDKDEDFMGRVYYLENLITLKKCLSEDMKQLGLLHEILHAISAHEHLSLEENVVKHLANSLWQVLRDNYGKELGI